LKNKLLAPGLIELSGGILANSTLKKEDDDEGNLVEKMIMQLKYMESLSLAPYPIPQHYLRFFRKISKDHQLQNRQRY
jgi:hypothetical protein